VNPAVALSLAAGITVVVETSLLAALGFRDRTFVVACILVNLASNLSVNLIYWLWPSVATLVIVEFAALIAEWLTLRLFDSRSWYLLGCLVLANAVTFAIGMLIPW
jgi:hypothetical protein